MTQKPKPPMKAPKSRRLTVSLKPGQSEDAQLAALATSAGVPAALVITDFSKSMLGEVSLGDVLDSLKEHAGKIKGGDMARVEAMLCGQAAALNSMFGELARRGAMNMGEYIDAAETYLKLALRAQSQCRATLETLAALKNPPVIFAKQANIAHGPQQVNIHAAPSLAHAEQNPKPQTELLEHDHGQRLDTGAASAASGSYQTVEAVGEVHRPANRRRKSQDKP